MKFKAKFIGRTKGAIGIQYKIETETEGTDKEAAILALYDRYENVHMPVLTPTESEVRS